MGTERDHKYCEKVLGHDRELARIDTQMDEIQRVKSKLFENTDALFRIAIRNETNIEEIKKTLDNGITSHLEKKIDHLCGLFQQVKKDIEETNKALGTRIAELEKTSWVTLILEGGVKKFIAYCLLAGLILGGVNLLMWGFAKEYRWNEKPGMMQGISKDSQTLMEQIEQRLQQIEEQHKEQHKK